jgi:hypothetical protein
MTSFPFLHLLFMLFVKNEFNLSRSSSIQCSNSCNFHLPGDEQLNYLKIWFFETLIWDSSSHWRNFCYLLLTLTCYDLQQTLCRQKLLEMYRNFFCLKRVILRKMKNLKDSKFLLVGLPLLKFVHPWPLAYDVRIPWWRLEGHLGTSYCKN